jgi:small-conductance mechanosensitive channel
MLRYVLMQVVLVLALAGNSAVPAAVPLLSTEGGSDVARTAPVRVDGIVLFPVRGITAHPAKERAANIAARITEIAGDPKVRPEDVVVVNTDQSTDIIAGDRPIMSVFDEDAELEGFHRQRLGLLYAQKIRKSIETYRKDRASTSILWAAGTALGATLLLVVLVLFIRRGSRRMLSAVESRFTSRIQKLQAKSHDIVRTEWIWLTIRIGVKSAAFVLILLILFLHLDLVLRLFPWTRSLAVPLLEMLLDPVRSIGGAVLAYIPNLAFLAVLYFFARIGLRALNAFFVGIQRGRIVFSGFDPEWAVPMYKLARLGVIAFIVVVAYPYIPGSESPAFKGISLFLGIVFSIGSSSSVSNFVAGYMVIFRRAYKVGDRVKIGAHTGDVVEMRLQVTHLRTIKNEEVIVPNSMIINTEVVNYSSLARKGGLILHTTVTIGYDTPWRQVHALLLLAAERTPRLLGEPKPFVLQTALNDFYVSYELNVYTDRPLEMISIYSDLHRSIQDAFNEFGVQIMSPHYLGDPSQAKIVPKEQWFQAPARQDGPAEDRQSRPGA